MARTEYDSTREAAFNSAFPPFFRQVFEDSIFPVVEAGKAEIVEDYHELLGCITLRPAPGHSPGNIRIELESFGEHGVFAGDILHSPLQVPFWNWSSIVCSNKDLAAESRRNLLEFCEEKNALLLSGHFEAPHVGRIRVNADTFAIKLGW